VSGTHGGFELDASYGIGFARGNWYFEPSVGLTRKSSGLNDYYWGIRPFESNEATPVYTADEGINARARLRASYYFSRNWSATLSAEYERINRSVADSPIVDDDTVLGWFAGMAWRF
jgi:outer membrane scaffolding protein for murein synthesis (MipA/OmpV family)